jgi:hypothetical protein
VEGHVAYLPARDVTLDDVQMLFNALHCDVPMRRTSVDQISAG